MIELRKIVSTILILTFTITSIPCLEAAQLAPQSRFSKELSPVKTAILTKLAALHRRNPILWTALIFAPLNTAAYFFGTSEDFVGVLGVTTLYLTGAGWHNIRQRLDKKQQEDIFEPHFYPEVFLGGTLPEAEQVLLEVIKSRFGKDESIQLIDAASQEILSKMKERGELEAPGALAKGEILQALMANKEAQGIMRSASKTGFTMRGMPVDELNPKGIIDIIKLGNGFEKIIYDEGDVTKVFSAKDGVIFAVAQMTEDIEGQYSPLGEYTRKENRIAYHALIRSYAERAAKLEQAELLKGDEPVAKGMFGPFGTKSILVVLALAVLPNIMIGMNGIKGLFDAPSSAVNGENQVITVPVSVPVFHGGEIGEMINEVSAIDSSQFKAEPEMTDADRKIHKEIKSKIAELGRRMSEVARAKEALDEKVALPQEVAALSEQLNSQADRLETLPVTTSQLERQRQSLPNKWNSISSGGGASRIPRFGKGEGAPFFDAQLTLDDIGPGQVTHGSGNRSIGEWVADVEGGNGYLAKASYSKINPLTGEYLPVESSFQNWQLDAQSNPSGWGTISTDGRREMILPVPPEKKVVTIETENPAVRGAVYYDYINKIWAAKFDSSPGGFIRIGIEDAESDELGDVPQVGITETVPESWRENLPDSVRQALEEARGLSIEERSAVKKKILGLFYYTTNPYMEVLDAKSGDFLKTAFTYYALKCDGFAMLDAILSHELGIPAVIQRGFLDLEKNGTFTSGEAHAWVLTEDGIEEATSFAGEVSSLYGKKADAQAWKQELEYIKARAAYASRNLELTPEMMRLAKEEENLKQEIGSLEGDLVLREDDLDANVPAISRWGDYYYTLLQGYEKKLNSLNIPALASLGKKATPHIDAILTDCTRPRLFARLVKVIEGQEVPVATIRSPENDCRLMAEGHFVFKVLAQLEEALAKLEASLPKEEFDRLHKEILTAKKMVYDGIELRIKDSRARGARAEEWDSLREPFPKDAELPSSEMYGETRYDALKRNEKVFEDLVIIPCLPAAGEVKTRGDKTVRDLITGKEYKIPHNAELESFSQGLLVIKIPQPEGRPVLKIIGDKAGKCADMEFSGAGLFTALNGDWLAIWGTRIEGIDGPTGLPVKRIDHNFIGPLAEKCGVEQLNDEIAVVDTTSVAVRSDGKWIARVFYSDTGPKGYGGTEGYVGSLAQEAGLQGVRFKGSIGNPIILSDGSWVGLVKDNDGSKKFVGSPYAEKLNEDIQKAVDDDTLLDCKVLPNGDWVAFVEYDKNGASQCSFVGPLAERWNLTRIEFAPEFKGIARIFPEGLMYVLKRNGTYYITGPLIDRKRDIDPGPYNEVSDPIFSSDGKWAAIAKNNPFESGGSNLIGTLIPSETSGTWFHEIKNSYGLEGFDINEDGSYGVWARLEDAWMRIEFSKRGLTTRRYLTSTFKPKFLDPCGSEYVRHVREQGLSYKRRIQGLYHVGASYGDDDYLADRPDVMWRCFDNLAGKGDGKARGMLLRLIFWFNEFEIANSKGEIVCAPRGPQEIIQELKEYLAAAKTSTSENPAPRFYDHQEAMRILEKHLDWCIRNLDEQMELPVLFTFLQRTGSGHLIVEAVNKAMFQDGSSTEKIRNVVDAMKECAFTPNELNGITSDYIKWLRAKHEIPEGRDPYIYPKRERTATLNKLLLTELNGKYREYGEELYDAFINMDRMWQYDIEFFGDEKGKITPEKMKAAFALLREQSGMRDRLFDAEVAPSAKRDIAYKLVQLLRKNWVGFKFEDQENLRKWKRINQELKGILGEDFAGEENPSQAWKMLAGELIHDAFGIAFLIGAVYFCLSYVSDRLRRKDKILGSSAQQIIDRILKENPWLTKEKAALRDSPLRGQSLSSLTEKERAIFDCISAVALEPPSKSKSVPARLLNLIPFAPLIFVRDTREHRMRQAMNREILNLGRSIDGQTSPREIRVKLLEILNSYGERKEIKLPQDAMKRAEPLTPDEVETKIRDAIKGVPLLRISPIAAHSLKPNGSSLKRAGQGVEFFELREYQYGDDVGTINWRASARLEKPVIKVTETDITKAASILIDMRALFDAGETEIWLQELARSLTVMLDKRRLYDKQHYVLNKLIFIMPDGEVEIEGRLNIRRGGINAIMPILRQKYTRAKDMMEALDQDKAMEYHLKFYTDGENARYAKRTRDILQTETETAKRLDQHMPRLNLRGEVVFCVGIQKEKREGISGTLARNRTTPLFWRDNQAQQALRRSP